MKLPSILVDPTLSEPLIDAGLWGTGNVCRSERKAHHDEYSSNDHPGAELEDYLRDAALTYWHQVGTAKMGNDTISVVDSSLKVYGLEGLRIADASIMPRITTGNTMAPRVVIGERAAELLASAHPQ